MNDSKPNADWRSMINNPLRRKLKYYRVYIIKKE